MADDRERGSQTDWALSRYTQALRDALDIGIDRGVLVRLAETVESPKEQDAELKHVRVHYLSGPS